MSSFPGPPVETTPSTISATSGFSFISNASTSSLASVSATASTSSDIKLWGNKKEQALYESYADLYAIIKTTEKLERAFVRDAVSAEAYEEACSRLIGQFKVLWGSLKDSVPSVEKFMSDYNMACPLAATRLLHSGLPATVEHKTKQNRTNDADTVPVAETVQAFITTMDALKLGMTAVDQVVPLLLELINDMDKIGSLPPDFAPRAKVKEWYSRLYSKAATYELPEADSRQLMYDLEHAYSAFMTVLRTRPGMAMGSAAVTQGTAQLSLS